MPKFDFDKTLDVIGTSRKTTKIVAKRAQRKPKVAGPKPESPEKTAGILGLGIIGGKGVGELNILSTVIDTTKKMMFDTTLQIMNGVVQRYTDVIVKNLIP